MIPTVFVFLDTLPLTANGKVDRAALPIPDTANTARDADISVPTTLIEKQIANILAQLLGLERVGLDDNFFLLGGHSLLGTQVILRIADTFGVDLTLRILFDAATVRQLSIEVERLLVARLEEMSEDEALQLLAQDN
jgi:acyl carrier protein